MRSTLVQQRTWVTFCVEHESFGKRTSDVTEHASRDEAIAFALERRRRYGAKRTGRPEIVDLGHPEI